MIYAILNEKSFIETAKTKNYAEGVEEEILSHAGKITRIPTMHQTEDDVICDFHGFAISAKDLKSVDMLGVEGVE